MGFLKHLLFWPVTGPMYLTEFSLGKVQGVVKRELTDDTPVKEALLDLQLDLELGEIDEHEYERRETELMDRLRDVRRWRREFGMATRGGVVQVGDAAGGREREPRASGPGGQPVEQPDEETASPADGPDDADAPDPSGTVVGGGTRATLDVSLDWDEPAPEPDESDGPDDSDGPDAAEDGKT